MIHRYRRRPLMLRALDTLRDVPAVLADRITDNHEPRWFQALMTAALLLVVVTLAIEVVVWRLGVR